MALGSSRSPVNGCRRTGVHGNVSASLHAVPSDDEPVTGHRATFEDFFRAEYDRLYRAVTMITGSRQEAEDALQVAFMKVFERWDRVAAMDNPQGYLYRVAMNEFRSRYRRTARTARRAFTPGEPDDAFAGVENRDVVIRALRGLIPQQRAAIVLTGLLGYSSEEAGRMLGVAPSTVRVLASRAREAIRQTAGDPA
jgi:RNA polymerase sigma factor (sigma-70 family)